MPPLMVARRFPWLLLVAPACTLSPPPSVAPAPPPAPPPPPALAAAPVASAAPLDPRIVRCGLDDRPRSVVSALEPPPARDLLAIRPSSSPPPIPLRPPSALPGASPARPRPAPPAAPAGSDAASSDTANPFDASARRRAPSDSMAPEPMPDPLPARLFIDRLPPTLVNGASPSAELSRALGATDPQYDVCASLIREGESVGPVTFDLELASSGAPLRVLPQGSGVSTPLVRCLMERTCQLQATASPPGETTRLQVPLRLRRDEPAPAIASAAAALALDVATEAPQPAFAELQLQLRQAAASAARSCGPVAARTSVRLFVALAPSPPAGSSVVVGSVTPQAAEGKLPPEQLACVTRSLSGRSLALPRSRWGRRSERLLLTWNP